MEQAIVRFRHNAMSVNSLSTFMNLKGGVNQGCRDVYFVRALGQKEGLAGDIARMDAYLGEEAAAGRLTYRRLDKLPALSSPETAETYARCCQEWAATGKEKIMLKSTKGNEVLACTLGNACRTVMECFRLGKQGVSETMEKNLLVKLLYWFDEIMAESLKGWNTRSCMKIVASCVKKEQEYLFFYLLTLIGADVLLLQTEKDVEVCPKWKRLSTELLLGAYGSCSIPSYQEVHNRPKAMQAVQRQASGSGAMRQDQMRPVKGEANEPIKIHLPDRNRRKPPSDQDGASVVFPARPSPASSMARPVSSPSLSSAARPVSSPSLSSAARPVSSPAVSPVAKPAAPEEKSFEELALLASSVVMIAVHDRAGNVIGTGSGIMIGRGGYILTNNHVVAGGRSYSVRIEDDEKIYDTDEVIKYNNVLDLAILRIERSLKPIPIYKGKQGLVRGQKVVAIGSPLGLFNSVSDGIISGFRKIDEVDMIQFTAPTSHGSSGGAVLNMQGEVVGISTAGIDSGQNLNLAMGYECINMFVKGFE